MINKLKIFFLDIFVSDGKDSNERLSKLSEQERQKSRTCVFINKRFKEGLNIQFSRINITDIGGELY